MSHAYEYLFVYSLKENTYKPAYIEYFRKLLAVSMVEANILGNFL